MNKLSDPSPDASQARLRELGKTGLKVSALGVGTNRWRAGANDAAVFEAYQAAQDGGISFFDSAELYGRGQSERLLGECVRRDGRGAVIATKFASLPLRQSPRHLLKALDGSLARLGVKTIDLYYIHFPIGDLVALADAMIEAVKAGKVRSVGVSNFSAAQMRRVADRLARANIPLAANEVNYSLLARKPESNGVLEACRELGASLVAYFPLGRGSLAAAPDKGGRLAALQKLLGSIAQAHRASPSQVALNWLLARDPCIIPIPGSTRAASVRQNAGALGWTLSAEEFAAIDKASRRWR
jgi:aryl-alcohol dehydrogenase-like predicted oxidoreductase